jgi:hypothetical protein
MKTRAKNGGNDAYFTNPAIASEYVATIARLTAHREFSQAIEPSAGNGAFLSPMSDWFAPVKGFDLMPKAKGIIKSDWFNVTVPKRSIVIGNPPFGFAASLAIRFFNHAATGADVIAFVVPRSFQKESVHRKLNPSFHLIHEELCPQDTFLVDGAPYNVPCVFQIWERGETLRKIEPVAQGNPFFSFVAKADVKRGDFCIRRVGGRAGQVLDGTDHAIPTTYFVRPITKGAKQAVNACLPALKLLRDKTAGVRSISKHELNAVLTAYAAGDNHGKA